LLGVTAFHLKVVQVCEDGLILRVIADVHDKVDRLDGARLLHQLFDKFFLHPRNTR